VNWLKQPSTWRGIFVLAGLCGWRLHPDLQDALITAILAALALIEIIRNEHAPTPVNVTLPPIELIGQPNPDRADPVRGVVAERLPDPAMPPDRNAEASSGFNDR
jgi:hypothetical protein